MCCVTRRGSVRSEGGRLTGRQHILLLGGGHARPPLLKRLSALSRRGHRLTLLAPAAQVWAEAVPAVLAGRIDPGIARLDAAALVTGLVPRWAPRQRPPLFIDLGNGTALACWGGHWTVGRTTLWALRWAEGRWLL